ncbi:Protein of uncharacterised function (DUF3142) [Serratia fonticola]|jgi:hypothetical protein|uniref:DUF3142 domain-containing protein n=1 Tax=Serratia fonticola TaxID=47917 RepID=UPI00217BE634|nr:DUF3142 domain-containing protein [Serratia fonticola]CAI0854972.1 Protein of uncharacterised function (DUF3142) [Serratia fonticola]CAI0933296.1 Protein of uncharacterised function (DUF3142) [Serratia fonticola]CAI1937145.1 Protein of uncharacterised function (DUF3142) [Serratia fonticola]
MGTKAQILLVMRLLLLLWLSVFATAAAADNAASRYVNAHDYRAFWLWSGVWPQPALQQADLLYLHQGEIVNGRQGARFLKLGLPLSKLQAPAVWITVRVATLDMSDEVLASAVRLPARWAAAGNRVVGLQIDFDAATYQLDKYAEFLDKLRGRLPKEYALGVTGLLDWAKTGNVSQLNALPIDELVIQTYQGRRTVTEYERYLPALLKLQIPFKIGLVQQGDWNSEWQRRLATSPYYRGEVVFLLNTTRKTSLGDNNG